MKYLNKKTGRTCSGWNDRTSGLPCRDVDCDNCPVEKAAGAAGAFAPGVASCDVWVEQGHEAEALAMLGFEPVEGADGL